MTHTHASFALDLPAVLEKRMRTAVTASSGREGVYERRRRTRPEPRKSKQNPVRTVGLSPRVPTTEGPEPRPFLRFGITPFSPPSSPVR